MAYKKIHVDNTTCLRRFHISFDDSDKKEKIELKCPYCKVVVMSSSAHPPAKIVRDEVLTGVTSLSNIRTSDCSYEDKFKPKT